MESCCERCEEEKLCCGSGACESCACCDAGACVYGGDGTPEELDFDTEATEHFYAIQKQVLEGEWK